MTAPSTLCTLAMLGALPSSTRPDAGALRPLFLEPETGEPAAGGQTAPAVDPAAAQLGDEEQSWEERIRRMESVVKSTVSENAGLKQQLGASQRTIASLEATVASHQKLEAERKLAGADAHVERVAQTAIKGGSPIEQPKLDLMRQLLLGQLKAEAQPAAGAIFGAALLASVAGRSAPAPWSQSADEFGGDLPAGHEKPGTSVALTQAQVDAEVKARLEAAGLKPTAKTTT